MGGNPPLGYDARDRKLVINPVEAETVRYIFSRYLELGSVARLRAELDDKKISTKSWVSTRGKSIGDGRWYVGPLRHILHNRVYVGDAMHKGTANPGEHEPIISRDLFDAVQAKLDANCNTHQRKRTIGSDALLTGLIFDDRGNAMSPVKSRRQGGRGYLYYVSQARIQRRDPNAMKPVSGSAIEEIVRDRLNCITRLVNQSDHRKPLDSSAPREPTPIRELIRQLDLRVEVATGRLTITFDRQGVANHTKLPVQQIARDLRAPFPPDDRIEASDKRLILTVPVRIRLRGGLKRIEGWDQSNWTDAKPRHDLALIKALTRAHEWRTWIERGEISTLEELSGRSRYDRKYVRSILKLAFLAPDIQRAILTGRQPKTLTLAMLAETELPMLRAEQRTLLRTA